MSEESSSCWKIDSVGSTLSLLVLDLGLGTKDMVSMGVDLPIVPVAVFVQVILVLLAGLFHPGGHFC